MPLPVGTRLGPYEIDAQIGAGGMGEVYRARDTRMGRFVAIKTSHQHRRVARSLSGLEHGDGSGESWTMGRSHFPF